MFNIYDLICEIALKKLNDLGIAGAEHSWTVFILKFTVLTMAYKNSHENKVYKASKIV